MTPVLEKFSLVELKMMTSLAAFQQRLKSFLLHLAFALDVLDTDAAAAVIMIAAAAAFYKFFWVWVLILYADFWRFFFYICILMNTVSHPEHPIIGREGRDTNLLITHK